MMRAVLADLRIHEMPVLFLRRWDKQSTVRLGADILAYLRALHRFRRRVGLSLLHKSPIYWNAPLYDRLVQLLFGPRHEQAYVDVAQQIPEGASVVDLCSGTGKMYRDHLRSRDCQYLGLDFNGHFVVRARRSGVPTRFFNVLSDTIPPADYVVMMSSLYHFRRGADELIERMKAAARRAVIISEPVDNLSHHDSFLGRLAPHLTNPGVGEYDHRYSLAELQALMSAHGASAFLHRPGDRNAIAVFRRDPA
jgi:SAM-dependent methyltransferase